MLSRITSKTQTTKYFVFNLKIMYKLDLLTTNNQSLQYELSYLKKSYLSLQNEYDTLAKSNLALEEHVVYYENKTKTLQLDNTALKQNENRINNKLAMEVDRNETDKLKIQELELKIKHLESTSNKPTGTEECKQTHPQKEENIVLETKINELVGNNKLLNSKLNELKLKHDKAIEVNNILEAKINGMDEDIMSSKVQILANELNQLKEINLSLIEENEGYQYLLEEKTLNGEFMLNTTSNLNNNNNNIEKEEGFNLANELDLVNDNKLDEAKKIKEENKALALYINKILGRIMSNPILSEAMATNCDQPSKRNSRIGMSNIKLKQSMTSLRNKELINKPIKSSPLTPNRTEDNNDTNTNIEAVNNKTKPHSKLFDLLSPISPQRITFNIPQFSSNNKEQNITTQDLLKGASPSFSSPSLVNSPPLNEITKLNRSQTTLNETKDNKISRSKSMATKKTISSNTKDNDNDYGDDEQLNNHPNKPSSYLNFKSAFKRMGNAWKGNTNNN